MSEKKQDIISVADVADGNLTEALLKTANYPSLFAVGDICSTIGVKMEPSHSGHKLIKL